MNEAIGIRRSSGKAQLSWLLVFTLIFSLIAGAWPQSVSAKSARSAIVKEVTGNVTYTKAGGSRTITVYKDLTLNQGDLISTGAGASVVLSIVDREDEVTVGENAEVYIADLMEDGGKKSKFTMWAGSVWSKVKSLVSSEDEFEVDTPTAVMGVRGTHLLTAISPFSGRTQLMVASGVVRFGTVSAVPSETEQGTQQQMKTVLVYPAQQINLDARNETQDLRTKVELVSVDQLVKQTPTKVLEQIVKNIEEIRSDNERIKEKLQEQFQTGVTKPAPESTLKLADLNDLAKVGQNFDNLIGNIAKQAVDEKKLEQKWVEELNRTKGGLDLSKVKPLDPSAGIDPEVVKAKQEAQQAQARLAGEQRQLLENQQRLAGLLKKLEEERKRLDEANSKARIEAEKKAVEQLKSQLSDSARKAFEEQASKNNPSAKPFDSGTSNGSSDNSGGTSGGSSGGGGNTGGNGNGNGGGEENTSPAVPVLEYPKSSITVTEGETVKVAWSAPVHTEIQVFNGEQLVGKAQGKGTRIPTEFKLEALPAGIYNLKAYGIRDSKKSEAAEGLVITVIRKDTQKKPAVTLKQVDGVQGSQVKLQLAMENFTSKEAFYAVEAHLLYDKQSLNYTGPQQLADADSPVFSGTNAAATLKQVTGASQKELIFAGTRFETAGTAAADMDLNGATGTLAVIPLQVSSSTTAIASVQLLYVKVVDKKGNTVYELSPGQELPVHIQATK